MLRTLILTGLLAIPAVATAGTYAATPAAATNGRVITRTATWTCGDTGCTATSDASRPVVLCQGLAKQVGPLSAFSGDGRALNVDELAACNALARAGATPALAKN